MDISYKERESIFLFKEHHKQTKPEHMAHIHKKQQPLQLILY